MGNLYTYLIRNGLNTIELTPYIYSENDNDLKLEYLKGLKRIDLKSTQAYSKDSAEFKIFDMLQTLSNNEQSKTEIEGKIHEILNDSIYIDDIPLGEKNISDNVFFEFKSNDESAKDEKYELKLSKILPSYKDQTEALTNVIDNFESSVRTFLKSKVFKARPKPKNEIFKEIKEAEARVLTAYQIFFLILHNRNHPTVKVYEGKLGLNDYFNEFGETEIYKNNVIELLEILNQFKLIKSTFRYVFNGIDIKNAIYNQFYAIKEEKLPNFILDWIEKDLSKKAEKEEFLFKLGLNSDDSDIVLLRRGLIENDKESFEKGKVNLENETLMLNTMKWLNEKQEAGTHFLEQLDLINDFYEKLSIEYKIIESKINIAVKQKELYKANPMSNPNLQLGRLRNINETINNARTKKYFLRDKLYVPVLDTLYIKKYIFKKADLFTFHKFSREFWKPYHECIFDFIKSKDEYVLDDLFPVGFEPYIDLNLSKVEERLNSEELLNSSNPIQELFPHTIYWPKIEEITIRIYNMEAIPVKLFYGNDEVKSIEGKTEIQDGEIYYTCLKEKHGILSSLKVILDEDGYNSLFTFFNENKIVEEEVEAANKTISFSEEESKALESLFGNDIPPEFFKDLNLAACVAALVQLNKDKDYDVTKAEIDLVNSHKYSQIEPVLSLDREATLIVMCRSAVGGILYLRASSWDRLDDDEIKLFVKTGRKDNQFHLFNNKQSILDISQTNYQVFRVEAESLDNNTDAILEGKFDRDKIWLIFKMKDNPTYNSIFDGGIRQNESNPDFDNLSTDENSNY